MHEYEYRGSDYERHRHPKDGWGLIVYWKRVQDYFRILTISNARFPRYAAKNSPEKKEIRYMNSRMAMGRGGSTRSWSTRTLLADDKPPDKYIAMELFRLKMVNIMSTRMP